MPDRPSYADMAKTMMGLAVGGPIATLDYAARGIGGNLLFPGERLSPYRNNAGLTREQVQSNLDKLPPGEQQEQYLRSLGMIPQRLPGTDVAPIQQQTQAR